MNQIINEINDFYFFLLDDESWVNRDVSKDGKLGKKVECVGIHTDSDKPWKLPIINYKRQGYNLEKPMFAYLNEFFIQKKDSPALDELFYDTSR